MKRYSGWPRLDDSQLAQCEAIAAAPLPALVEADELVTVKTLRMMATLPRRKDDELSGKLRLRAYEIAIGSRSVEELQYLAETALRKCQFFPSPSECLEILRGFERNDQAAQAKRLAAIAARNERQARFDELMKALAAGQLDQAQIDALPESVKEIAETRGHLRRSEGGAYWSPIRARLEAEQVHVRAA